jgi:hypothetical protein
MSLIELVLLYVVHCVRTHIDVVSTIPTYFLIVFQLTKLIISDTDRFISFQIRLGGGVLA